MQNLEELVVQNIKVPPLATLPGTSEPGADLFSAVADMIGFRHASRDTVPGATLGTINYVAQGTSLDYCATKPRYMAWVGWDEAAAGQPGLTGYSSDNGKTWAPFASTSPGFAGKIAMSATDPNWLVWSPANSAPPQYSTDAGRTWQVCPLNGRAPNQKPPRRFPLFHSADGGKTFSAVASVDGANFAAFGKGTDVAPSLYLHGRAGGATTDAIYRSLDLGTSWTRVSDPTQQQFGNISALEADMRQADLVYAGTGGRGIFYGVGPGTDPSAPSLTPQGVVNAASYQGGGVAPGEVLAIFGQRAGPASLAAAALDETGSLSPDRESTRLNS